MRPVRPSSHQPPSLCITPYICRTVCPSHSQSVRHPHPSVIRTVRPPSCHSILDSSVCPPPPPPPVSPAKCPSDCPSLSDCLYTILTHPSGCPTSSDYTSTIYTHLSDHPPLSHHLYNTPTSPSVCL